MLKAILFDLDMTLLDRDRLYRDFSAELLCRYLPGGHDAENYETEHKRMIVCDNHGYGMKKEVYQPLFDVSMESLTLSDIVRLWADFAKTHVKPLDGVPEVLENLSRRFRLGIVTNGQGGPQRSKLEGSGLAPLIQTLVISGEIGIEKPDPRIFQYALQVMGLTADEVIYVGDHPVKDALGASGAGIRTVWIPTEAWADTDVQMPENVIRLKQIRELPAYIRTIEATETEEWPGLLVDWYREEGRILPWRGSRDPYRVWVSEIMLQQTRTETVSRYYDRFIEAFPDINTLASAPEAEVYKYWEGLGYYRRLKHMLAAAHKIQEEEHGIFPRNYEAIRRLPGVGAYTAGAICSIAYGEPYPAVDGNVMRVISRLYALESDIMKQKARTEVHQLLRKHIPAEDPAAFTQGLMDLGSMICVPKAPVCEECPLEKVCKARMLGLTDVLPVRKKAKAQKDEYYRLLLVLQNGRVLLVRRAEGQVLGGLWGFPMIPVDPEDFRGIAEADDVLFDYTHTFTHIRWHIAVSWMQAGDRNGWMDLTENQEYLFADRSTIERFMIPSAFRKPLETIQGILT